MPVKVSTNSKQSAIKLIEQCELDFNTSIQLSEDSNNYIRYLAGSTKEECLSEIEQGFENITGSWCFLFTGQGAQTPKMMYSLYETLPIYKKYIDRCCEIYEKIFSQSLKQVLLSENEEINQTQWTQPALFAVEYSMAMHWIESGLKPKYVLGHSVGEYPAAVIAEIMSLETGIELIGNRGMLMQSINSSGSMAAVMADLATTKTIASDLGLDIAGINSVKQTVISGDTDKIKKFIELAKLQKIKARELTVSHAFHSSHMEAILPEYAKVANQHMFKISKECSLISNISGEILSEVPDGAYWASHIRKPVNFVDGIQTAAKLVDNFLEVGPHPVLSGLGAKTITNAKNWLASYSNNKNINTYNDTYAKLANSKLINNS